MIRQAILLAHILLAAASVVYGGVMMYLDHAGGTWLIVVGLTWVGIHAVLLNWPRD